MTESVADTASAAVAQKIVMDYFMSIMTDRENVPVFYARDAVLSWENQNYNGQQQIKELFSKLPEQVTFKISGYDVQPVIRTDLLTTVIVFGTYQVSGFKLQDFHSVFYVYVRRNEGIAYIKYQVFTTF
ncbi:hypothetical protein TVAG_055990 [Trichomonas vaginalis G3]|uniref:Nuclear transport factor 2 n=1 Tax=Trichomonas vaginalis (strain ATCC PRA-98 / G3) TaxID=412133 RepID=A2EL52_TRIV3|nr:NTF2-like family [Trichomonas vaginalis G3]EAY06605.1 hypothetical protein TVAG_055990 [Trichomonas vaginalis G3]KAI5551647.1 NTF2-like family [Trichomonas vaginalis G3]|eukprot:XP_001318828.1 hypothetical protein [Trichomonas vaginalis G3]